MAAEFTEISSVNSSRSDSPIPSVIERLGQLRPSKELLEYYRKKLAEFDQEQEQLVSKLEEYKSTFEEQHKLRREVRQREDDISELQKALSDMQVFLFQERENVLRLYAENDRLKIQELDDRKKIQHLLSLSSPDDNEITYFVKDHPVTVVQKHDTKKAVRNSTRPQSPILGHRDRIGLSDRGPGGHRFTKNQKEVAKKEKKKTVQVVEKDRECLLLQIQALQAQLEEKVKFTNDHVATLEEDRQVKTDEYEAQRQKDTEKIQILNDKLKNTQTILYDSTKDFLELKYENRLKERKWMGERDKILQEMDYLKDQIDLKNHDVEMQLPMHVNAGTQMSQQHQEGQSPAPVRLTSQMVIKQLRSNLEQTQNMAEMYREQVIGLEDELARIREENDVGKDVYKEKMEKLGKRLHVMKQRYDSLEKRRTLEVEGFKNDIKILRGRLKDVEKQLFKVTVNIGEQFDWEILQNVHKTANRSKKLTSDLHGLKSKVYEMERELRHL
ncbi:coiled-coil domain-containing protein 77-like [Clytia hemisphaerica]|uniref:coiled-coil domain-containing protein 77-like n=1 Tax=Clytia hemisphaerica TaxID=252671 RepID=UPI0034D598F7